MLKRLVVSGVAAAVLSLLGPAARADIVFAAGNNPGPNEENILFGTPDSGTGITGFTNQSGIAVTFTSLTGQTLVQNAQGQADIFCGANCVAGGTQNMSQLLSSLEVKLQAGYGSTDFIGNLNFGEGTALIRVMDQLGAEFDFTLGNGQNFFTLEAINGEVITDIQITRAANSTDPFGWNDFKQPRISGVCALTGTACSAAPVPEPVSLALLGGGLLVLGLVRRRQPSF